MALAAASLPRSRQQEDLVINEKQGIADDEEQQTASQPAPLPSTKVLINPIAAYSQQLADKQLHIARVSDDGVHWRRKEAAGATATATATGDCSIADNNSSKRQGGYFKDKLLGRLTTSKSSDTALQGGMLDREFTDEEYAAVAARLDVGDTSRLDDGHAIHGARVPRENACMHPVGGMVNGKTNGHASCESNGVVDDNNQVDDTSNNTPTTTTTTSKENGHIATPSDDKRASRTISGKSSPLILPEEESFQSSDTPAVTYDPPSRYGTPADRLASTPSPSLRGEFHTPTEEVDSESKAEDASTSTSSHGQAQGVAAATSKDQPTIEGFPFSNTSTAEREHPVLYVKPSTATTRQDTPSSSSSKPIPPPLTALQFLPQANVIPPTPPTASTSASFQQQADTSIDNDTETTASSNTSQKQQAQQQPARVSRVVPSSPKSPRTPSSPSSPSQAPLYLSPESIRKTSPSHKRSQSYQVTTAAHRGSVSSGSGSVTTGPPLATPSLGSSQPPRRLSLLPPITTSTAINFNSDAALRKRSMSPRRALSFRGGGSGTALPTSGGVLYDEPMSIEEQAEQRRQADQLDETIARQAEQIRQERLSKRIETQRAHEKALALLREEDQARKTRGEDTGASALLSGSPPGRDGLPSPLASAANPMKGKERERGDTASTAHTTAGDASPTSPVSVHKQLWSSSPVAGEKAVLRGPDPALSEKAVVYNTKEKTEPEPERVLVGNLIGEDHVNYVLMYNMLTGIRIGVSRCEAKNHRPLTDADYTAQHKFSFDIVGNELTPSARYDFKFKDYAPWVFRELRAHFHLDPADYLLSLTAKYILSELGSPGKSGSFFYFSRDYRFIIKTISHTEHKFFRKILKDYHKHVLDNPNTLISRFYGLHRVKLPHGRKIHFVIMNNLFPPHRDVHETFDLKGSSVGREYPEELAAKKPRATLKDLNWIHRHRQIDFGPYKRHLFEEQLHRDVELLQRLNIMDYSLLIGIHDMGRGNKENLRDGMLTVFSPEGGQGGKLRRRPTHRGDLEREHTAAELRKAVQRADPQVLSNGTYQLPQKDKSERRYFVFYQDEGGIRATDQYDQNENKIYYLGVIDILTPYNWRKRIEHFWRSMQYDKHRISAVPPKEYGDRFLGFLISSVRGGDQSKRPKME